MNNLVLKIVSYLCFLVGGMKLVGMSYFVLIGSQQHEASWYARQGAYSVLLLGAAIFFLGKSNRGKNN